MVGTSKTIVKNASVLMASQLVTWMLTLLLTVFLPRYLGAAAVGELHLANSIWAIMGVLIAFGTDTLLVKEIARYPAKTAELLGTALILRGLFYLVCCGIVALYVHLLNYAATTVYVIYLIGFSQLMWQFGGACQAVLQGLEIMEYISISNIVGKAVNTGLGIAVLLLGYGVYAVGVVVIAAGLINLLLLLVFLGRRQRLHLHIDLTQARAMLAASAPYLMSGLALVIYMQVDILVISSLVDQRAVGWYGAADQLFGTFLFVPVVFIAAVFPALSRTHTSDPTALPQLMRKSFDLMLLISVPIGLGLVAIADPLVILLFGPGFAQSGPILAVLGIVLIFTYQNILLGQFLISIDRQNAWTMVMLIATVVTVPLDLVFVRWCQAAFGNGALGGAFSFVVTELGMIIAGIVLLPKGSLGMSNVRVAVRVIIAGLVMLAVCWWCRSLFIVVPIVAGSITYAGMILMMRVVPKEDVVLLTGLARRVLGRLRRHEAEPVGITGV